MVGSPPLTRGLQRQERDNVRGRRFTPAHAGNTLRLDVWLNADEVHPRSRGEYFLKVLDLAVDMGSPPLTRGIHIECARYILGLGFTPAHAGNTFRPSCGLHLGQVHPRSRGEYIHRLLGYGPNGGSPPLTRGIQGHAVHRLPALRFTPAHAGNT